VVPAFSRAFLNITPVGRVMACDVVAAPAKAVIIAYLMPVITTFLAWPLLGSAFSAARVIALFVRVRKLVLMAHGIEASWEKLPGA